MRDTVLRIPLYHHYVNSFMSIMSLKDERGTREIRGYKFCYQGFPSEGSVPI